MKISTNRISGGTIAVPSNCTHLAIVYAEDVDPFRDVHAGKKAVRCKVVAAVSDVLGLGQFLQNLKELRTLHICSHLQLAPFGNDLGFLSGASQVRDLYLGADVFSKIRDSSPMRSLVRLQALTVNHYVSWDLAHLNCPGIEELSAYCPGARHIHLLAQLPNLKKLGLWQYCAQDLSLFAGLTELRELRLIAGNVAKATGLEKLQKLQRIEMPRLGLKDASALSYLCALEYLELGSNRQLQDLSFLQNLKSLRVLKMLSVPSVKSFKPLADLPRLEHLDLTAKPLDGDVSPLRELLPRLRERYLNRSVEKKLEDSVVVRTKPE